MRGPIRLTGRESGLLSAVFAACVCSIAAALPTGCAAPATPPTDQRANGSAVRGVAWRSPDRLASPRTLALSIGAGDRIGARLEDARVARAMRERDALTARTAAGSAAREPATD